LSTHNILCWKNAALTVGKLQLPARSNFYAPQLYRQVLLRRVLAMAILSVCHDPVIYQAQVR